jgi:DNA-binding HxlR family transcriptional regulator
MKNLAAYTQPRDALRERCPVRAALDVIRGRWKPSILHELESGTRRFTQIQATMPEVTGQALTVQLRQLEADGVIHRTVHAEVPARVDYALTADGQALARLLNQLGDWGETYLERQTESRSA